MESPPGQLLYQPRPGQVTAKRGKCSRSRRIKPRRHEEATAPRPQPMVTDPSHHCRNRNRDRNRCLSYMPPRCQVRSAPQQYGCATRFLVSESNPRVLFRSRYRKRPRPRACFLNVRISKIRYESGHGPYQPPWPGRKRHRALCGRLSGWEGLAQRRRRAEGEWRELHAGLR
jgi:hypothetical protein